MLQKDVYRTMHCEATAKRTVKMGPTHQILTLEQSLCEEAESLSAKRFFFDF